MTKICEQAENKWFGVQCGLLNQLVISVARARQALLLDCLSLEFEYIPLPERATIAVMDTSTRRELVNSINNQRRAECNRAVRSLDGPALRI